MTRTPARIRHPDAVQYTDVLDPTDALHAPGKIELGTADLTPGVDYLLKPCGLLLNPLVIAATTRQAIDEQPADFLPDAERALALRAVSYALLRTIDADVILEDANPVIAHEFLAAFEEDYLKAAAHARRTLKGAEARAAYEQHGIQAEELRRSAAGTLRRHLGARTSLPQGALHDLMHASTDKVLDRLDEAGLRALLRAVLPA